MPAQLLDISTLSALFNFDALYQILFSFLFGMTIWVTFIGGFIAIAALPRQQFGTLQAKSFPIYFGLSLGLDSALLALWTLSHPDVIPAYLQPQRADVAQAYALVVVGILTSINLFVLSPYTTKIMFQRHRLEREEGKGSSDPTASPAMKALNKKFGSLHGISSLTNLGAVIGLIFHGLWLGTFGLQKY